MKTDHRERDREREFEILWRDGLEMENSSETLNAEEDENTTWRPGLFCRRGQQEFRG